MRTNRLSIRLLTALLAAALLVSACSGGQSPAASGLEIPGLAQTLAAQTLTAQQGVHSPFIPTATPTPAFVAPPPTLAPPAAAQAHTATPNPALLVSDPNAGAATLEALAALGSQANAGCTNIADYLGDKSMPDNTRVKGGQSFTKIWRFMNAGTCTWTTDYRVLFLNGDRMRGQPEIPLAAEVPPGGTIDIIIPMSAPTEPGPYYGNWIFCDPQGNTFGTGVEGRGFFWVAIRVAPPPGCSGGG
ncbi:MAG: NBR1-Ig-like domain-containing protein [Chloroflexota bacterium]